MKYGICGVEDAEATNKEAGAGDRGPRLTRNVSLDSAEYSLSTLIVQQKVSLIWNICRYRECAMNCIPSTLFGACRSTWQLEVFPSLKIDGQCYMGAQIKLVELGDTNSYDGARAFKIQLRMGIMNIQGQEIGALSGSGFIKKGGYVPCDQVVPTNEIDASVLLNGTLRLQVCLDIEAETMDDFEYGHVDRVKVNKNGKNEMVKVNNEKTEGAKANGQRKEVNDPADGILPYPGVTLVHDLRHPAAAGVKRQLSGNLHDVVSKATTENEEPTMSADEAEEILIDCIDSENVADLALDGHRFTAPKLKFRAFEYMATHPNFNVTPSFIALTRIFPNLGEILWPGNYQNIYI